MLLPFGEFFFLVYTLNDRLILVGRFGRIMPFLVVSTILSGLQYFTYLVLEVCSRTNLIHEKRTIVRGGLPSHGASWLSLTGERWSTALICWGRGSPHYTSVNWPLHFDGSCPSRGSSPPPPMEGYFSDFPLYVKGDFFLFWPFSFRCKTVTL
jgi:hypothetical protein